MLDGEVCAFDEQLVSHTRLRHDAEPGGLATPSMYVAFDCLLLPSIVAGPPAVSAALALTAVVQDSHGLVFGPLDPESFVQRLISASDDEKTV